jgi:hypothetical protein
MCLDRDGFCDQLRLFLQDSEWAKLLNDPLFSKATSGGPTVEHLTNIYLERCHLLWRPQEAQVSQIVALKTPRWLLALAQHPGKGSSLSVISSELQ